MEQQRKFFKTHSKSIAKETQEALMSSKSSSTLIA